MLIMSLGRLMFLTHSRGTLLKIDVPVPSQYGCTGCIKKTQPRNFLIIEITLQFLSIKDFRPLGIEIELLIVILLLLCIKINA